MSLRFYFGASGAGKSHVLHEELIEQSMYGSAQQSYLLVVPDQFTMQTQRELVTMHPRGGILNIDVLSFSRLSHRILEELGGEEIPVLDDTGKSLVLQKVAGGLKDQLPALGSFLHRQGYIHEVKSAISEFMQYGLAPKDVEQLSISVGSRGALQYKLQDLKLLYEGFLAYIQGNFITTEEKLDLVCRLLPESRLVKDSIIVFDGFTGFTPIQYRVLVELLKQAKEVIISLTAGQECNPYILQGEQKLFYLTQKTVSDLERLIRGEQIPRGEDVFVGHTPDLHLGGQNRQYRVCIPKQNRFAENLPLLHLEQNLFRTGSKPYEAEDTAPMQIHLMDALNPKEEIRQTGLAMLRLIHQENLAYRDFAVIVGNMDTYASYAETEFAKLNIPCYIDRTRGILLNPMTEYMKSALQLFIKDFSYDAVFHYLRSGMSGLEAEEIDRLDAYVRRTGLRGYGKWSRNFLTKTEGMEEENLTELNRLRGQVMDGLSPLCVEKNAKAGIYVEGLYEFLVSGGVQEKLMAMAEKFREAELLTKAKEYEQIYRYVMDLLNQIYQLMGEEEISAQEFYDILEAGLGEIQVGTIPQNVDRVLVGDMERTRLKQVKVLFFLGVNDGSIPKGVSKGGIISDLDREVLKESLKENGKELAPTPSQQMFIQRLYLYLNLTKPSHRLYLSFARVGNDGKSLRPAYLIETMRNLFPALELEHPGEDPVLTQIMTPESGLIYLAEGLRSYAGTGERKMTLKEFYTLYSAYRKGGASEKQLEQLTEAAFLRYEEDPLSKEVAKALYGLRIMGSISRMETYASCAYQHFLSYGLSLKEREEFGFEAVDMGNAFHEVLDQFSESLGESEYNWFDFPEAFAEGVIDRSLERFAAQYKASVLYDNARNTYAVERMKRILKKTVTTLQYQLQKGDFAPADHEMLFSRQDHLAALNLDLGEGESMTLTGRIDRMDLARQEDKLYVKIVDYKSGEHDFDLAALYYGLQLQLVVYMNAAVEKQKKLHPELEVVPAAMLYYHVQDPLLEKDKELSEEAIKQEQVKKLRTKGIVNDAREVVELLHRELSDTSDVIPVSFNKDGSYSKASGVMSREDMEVVSEYVTEKIRKMGQEILAGRISCEPYEQGQKTSCTYCAYQKVCGFDPTIPGYRKRQLSKPEDAAVLAEMKNMIQGKEVTEDEG